MKMKNNKKSSLRSFRMRLLAEDLWEKQRNPKFPPPSKEDYGVVVHRIDY